MWPIARSNQGHAYDLYDERTSMRVIQTISYGIAMERSRSRTIEAASGGASTVAYVMIQNSTWCKCWRSYQVWPPLLCLFSLIIILLLPPRKVLHRSHLGIYFPARLSLKNVVKQTRSAEHLFLPQPLVGSHPGVVYNSMRSVRASFDETLCTLIILHSLDIWHDLRVSVSALTNQALSR